ncbi:formimidoylglutamate deiminase [Roseateles sp. BYS180W]|uniref:Formimidoylglutamate deiminase n=1 Tax=Roseateles rivi TaxID=3299028 RepID=A0ABW7FVB2_9BURK
MSAAQRLHAARAWVDGRMQADVLIEIGADGYISHIAAGQACPAGAEALSGVLLPGVVNAHSHAFQRAFAGLAERREAAADDFWSWRDRMYGVALRLSPEQLRVIATQLYSELLAGGYTEVCEFHYLHHREDGQPYEDELAMAWALAQAAQDVGLRLTLLPVLYAHAGFAQPQLRPDQRRFATDAAWVWRACQRINAARLPGVRAGVALHSLRAAHEADIRALQALVGDADVPIHIHVAEQQQEVRDCLAATGRRPLEELCRYGLDARWQLVHATHSTPAEIEAVARSGAGVVICPSTEGNLGDGLADLNGWLAAGVPMSIGSDSHVSRDLVEELRWLEYGQRLGLQRRCVAAQPPQHASTGERLFEAALRGGAAAARVPLAGLQVGARADLRQLHTQLPGLADVHARPDAAWMDGLLFSAPLGAAAAARTMVGGRWLAPQPVPEAWPELMRQLWAIPAISGS